MIPTVCKPASAAFTAIIDGEYGAERIGRVDVIIHFFGLHNTRLAALANGADCGKTLFNRSSI